MKIIDLSHSVSETSLIYPGDAETGAGFKLEQAASIERGNSVNGEVIRAGVHVLTHLDSPGHQIKDGKMVQDYPLEKFVQKAYLINLEKKARPWRVRLGRKIKKEDLEPHQDQIKKTGALLVRTGFDKIIERYEQDADFRQKTKISVNDLPKFTRDCAEWLASFGNLKLVGVDSLTVGDKAVHQALLQKDILLVEGLNLQQAPKTFLFFCLPWKLRKTNGAPCRAIGLII